MLFVGLSAASFFWQGDSDVQERLAFSSDGFLTVADSAGLRTSLRYDAITAVKFYEAADFGHPVTGGIVGHIREGLWKSDLFGEYMASTDTEIDCCVLICTENSAYAISYESAAATRALYGALDRQYTSSS